MNATTIFVIGIIGAGILTVIGILAVALRRGPSAGPITTEEIGRRGRENPPVVEAVQTQPADEEATAAVATLTEAPAGPPADPLTEKQTVSQAEFEMTRRKFLNRALYVVIGLALAQFALAGLSFFWPKLKGGFGTPVNAGNLDDIKSSLTDGATIVPRFVPAAQAWIVPFETSELPGSSYEEVPFVVAGGG
ncbi:MAG: hypothetical protein MUQ27_11725, partial [Acidimicrobiia bacterium]|nr:hypothetical protein [Acidimicrobiia bacterium]